MTQETTPETAGRAVIETCLAKAAALGERGQFRAALQGLRRAMQYDPAFKEPIAAGMASILSQIDPPEYKPELVDDLRVCYSIKSLDHQTLAHLTANQLLLKHGLHHESLPRGRQLHAVIDAMAGDGLWPDFLSSAINTNHRMERLLTAVRRALLLEYKTTTAIPENRVALIAALAQQCFANEYIFPVDESEQQALKQLESQPATGQQAAHTLLQAMYRPLTELDGAQNLTAINRYVADLIQYTQDEPNRERELQRQIRCIAPERDPTSQKVRAQYEQNPYPRWKAPPSGKKTAMSGLLNHLPNLKPQPFLNGHLEVLVAGCGTGFEPIDIAQMNTTVTAVDLSRASLAYAWRMAEKLGVKNVSFLQGDILELKALNRQFDLVVCTGVLHHMADPPAGLKSLSDTTRPGGVLKLGLYSRRARRRITEARRQITSLGLSPTAENIKQFRSRIFDAAPGSAIGELAFSDDLFTLSGCRDLLFHEHEHHFDLLEVAELIEQCGLTFVSLDPPEASIYHEFRNMFPDPDDIHNPAKWDRFEDRFPDTFLNMYQVWIQKT